MSSALLFGWFTAAAESDPNTELSLAVRLTYVPRASTFTEPREPRLAGAGLPRRRAPGTDRRWAIEASITYRAALGDHCSWYEVDCGSPFGGADGWPILGPRVTGSFRGALPGYRIEAVAGLAHVDMHQFGFLPLWEALVELGVAGEAKSGFGFVVGGDFGRAISYNVPVGEFGYRTYGISPFALRLGLSQRWLPRAHAWADPRYRFGLELSPFAADYS